MTRLRWLVAGLVGTSLAGAVYLGACGLLALRGQNLRRDVSAFLGVPVDSAQAVDPQDRFGEVLMAVARDPRRWSEGDALLRRMDRNWEGALTGSNAQGRALPPSAASAVPALVEAARSADPKRREIGVRILGGLGPASRPALPILILELVDGGQERRWRAERALKRIDADWARSDAARKAVPELVKRLADGGSSREAESLLRQIDPDWARSDAAFANVPWLIEKALADTSRFEAGWALETLDPAWARSPSARKAVPHLLSKIVSEDLSARKKAVGWLNRIDPDWPRSPEARGAISRLLEESVKSSGGTAAAEMLDKIDKDWVKSQEALQAVPALVARMADPGRDPVLTARLLTRIDPSWTRSSAGAVVARLTGRLRASDPGVVSVAQALQEIGPPAQSSAPALVPLLASPVPRINDAAYQALTAVDQDWPKRKEAQAVLPELLRRRPDYSIFDWKETTGYARVVSAIAQIGGDKAKEAVPVLISAAAGYDPDLAYEAEAALRKLLTDSTAGPDWCQTAVARQAVPSLRRELQGRLSFPLSRPNNSSSRPSLDYPRESPVVGMLVRTIRVLGRIGPGARDAVAELTPLKKDPEQKVQQAAEEAIAKICKP